MDNQVVVTRHKNLVTYLREKGVVKLTTPVIEHATSFDVAGKHVIGVLPLRLAALAASVTEAPLEVPMELRGKELSLKEIREYAKKPIKYSINTEAAVRAHACEVSHGVSDGSDVWCGSYAASEILKFNGIDNKGTKPKMSINKIEL